MAKVSPAVQIQSQPILIQALPSWFDDMIWNQSLGSHDLTRGPLVSWYLSKSLQDDSKLEGGVDLMLIVVYYQLGCLRTQTGVISSTGSVLW